MIFLFCLVLLPQEVKARFTVSFHCDILFRHDRRNQFRRRDVEAGVIDSGLRLTDCTGCDEHLGLDFVASSVVGGWVESATNEAGFEWRSVLDRNTVRMFASGIRMAG